jgi:hypothetical protein
MCVYVYPPIAARQRLSKNVTAATITHATTEQLLDASFSMLPCHIKVYQAISSSQNFLLATYQYSNLRTSELTAMPVVLDIVMKLLIGEIYVSISV